MTTLQICYARGSGDVKPIGPAESSPHLETTWAAIRSMLESLSHLTVTMRPAKSSASSEHQVPAHLRPLSCSHCHSTPPTLLFNTTVVRQNGSAHSEWKVLRQSSSTFLPKDLSLPYQPSETDNRDQEPQQIVEQKQSDETPPRKISASSHVSFEPFRSPIQSDKESPTHDKQIADIAVQASADLASESTQVDLCEDPSPDVAPVKRSVTRGRGRGRRSRGGGGGRQKRGAMKAITGELSDSLQTRSFRPRKSTCYLELPDDDEDDDNGKKAKSAINEELSEHDSDGSGSVSPKRSKKMRKRAASTHRKSIEKDEALEDNDTVQGKNPLLLKLHKRTDSGAEWKVETVSPGEETTCLATSKKKVDKRESYCDSDSNSTPRPRAISTDDAYVIEQEQLSYKCSLSDSDIAKSPRLSSVSEDAKVSGLPEEKAPLSPATKRRPRGPYSKSLQAKRRRHMMQPKKGGTLFAKAMKVCTAKSKMQPMTSKVQSYSPSEAATSEPAPPALALPTTASVSPAASLPPPVLKPEVFLSPGEDTKHTRSAIFTQHNKGKRRFKERRKTVDDTLILSKGKFKCNLCNAQFQTHLAAKKHWLNFHRVPGGSTSPSRDISVSDEPDLISEVSDSPSPVMPPVRPATPPLPLLPSFQSAPSALKPLASAPYAVPAPAPCISSFSYGLPLTYQSPNPVSTSSSAPEPEPKAPLDLPVRFLDTM